MLFRSSRSPEKFIPPELKRHVGRKVITFRREASTVRLEDGIDFDSTYGNLQNFAEKKFFQTIFDRCSYSQPHVLAY